jgi:hypothetical protein
MHLADMTEFTIVTAADVGYFTLLQGLLSSLSPLGKVPICVLDLGLQKDQCEELHDRGVITVVPGWDIAIRAKMVRGRHGKKIPLPDSYRAFTAQPFLPAYVRQGEILFWIDADAWVQDMSVIDVYLSEAVKGRLAITLEIDRCYPAPYWRLKSHGLDFIRTFGFEDGWPLAKGNTANVGVLALNRDAPHWKLWQEATQRAFSKFPHQRSQQMAMQHVIYNLKAPTSFLPAYCNWQTWESTPMWDATSGMLVEPQPPYRPIGVIHNAQEDKNAVFEVHTTEGPVISATMRHEDWNHRVNSAELVG